MTRGTSPSNAYNPHPISPSAGGGASSTLSGIVYQGSSEAAPLLPQMRERRGISMSRLLQVGAWSLVFFIFLSMVYHTCIHFMHCPLDPSTRDDIRLDWEKEEAQHAVLQHEWQHKNQEHVEIEQGWKRATERHEKEVARRMQEERARQERVRREWMREIEHHAREIEEMRRREREEREREREEWEWEREERERREEEERQKHHMFWGNVEAHTCTTYATREYTAQLMNLPIAWKHRLDACKATPLEIHGISYLPKTCEERVG
ncbi:hypothetical protein J3R83DRAFT_5752 [Lanmaoa asiatica]|nr:hypothetical protein J3R83DRAFT_5752 [Lanmaoa asiatica]